MFATDLKPAHLNSRALHDLVCAETISLRFAFLNFVAKFITYALGYADDARSSDCKLALLQVMFHLVFYKECQNK